MFFKPLTRHQDCWMKAFTDSPYFEQMVSISVELQQILMTLKDAFWI